MKRFLILNSLIRALLLTVVAITTGWLLSDHKYLLAIIGLVVLILLIINLVRYQSRVYSQVRSFFEAIGNEDFSQSWFPGKKDRITQELNQYMQWLKQYNHQIRIENRSREQYFEALIEHVGTGILTWDEKGMVLHANNSLKKMLGVEQLSHLKQIKKIDMQLAEILLTMDCQEERLYLFNGKTGNINLLMKTSVFKSQDHKLMLLAVQDINQQLDEKELDSWLKLIRVLTHEIMNTIAPITTITESLSSYFFKNGSIIEPDEVDARIIQNTVKGLEVIKEQGKGLVHFIELYRKFTRLPQPNKSHFEVNALLEKAIMLNATDLEGKMITHNIKGVKDDMKIYADESLIIQVLNNLMKNAIEAMENISGGVIELSAGENRSGNVEISVKDNGSGIPKELIGEIFVPFFTTRENGNGIGLSLSRQIMRMHGGTIRVHSTPNHETIFTLVF